MTRRSFSTGEQVSTLGSIAEVVEKRCERRGTGGTACQSVPLRETRCHRNPGVTEGNCKDGGTAPELTPVAATFRDLAAGGQGLLHGGALLIGRALIGALDGGGLFHVLLAGLLLGAVVGDFAEFVVADA
jgi:hypothetical protein